MKRNKVLKLLKIHKATLTENSMSPGWHCLAPALGVTRKTLSTIVNGRAGISPEMAIRLSMAFGTSPESWLNQQTQYDLWRAEKKRKSLKVENLSIA